MLGLDVGDHCTAQSSQRVFRILSHGVVDMVVNHHVYQPVLEVFQSFEYIAYFIFGIITVYMTGVSISSSIPGGRMVSWL